MTSLLWAKFIADMISWRSVQAGAARMILPGLASLPFGIGFGVAAAQKGQMLRLPIAHGEGCYIADPRTLDELEAEDRIAFRYIYNANGSLRDIAGVLNKERNVMGMMPHPERATEPLIGSTDGLVVFESMLRAAVHA